MDLVDLQRTQGNKPSIIMDMHSHCSAHWTFCLETFPLPLPLCFAFCPYSVEYARLCVYNMMFSCTISVEFSTGSFCLNFGNVKIILNNPNPTSSLFGKRSCLLKLIVFWLRLFTFTLSIFDPVSLHFRYNLFKEANFALIILEIWLCFFAVQLLLNW